MLQYERFSCTSDSGLSTQELCHSGAEAAVLAAEVRNMLEQSYQADKQVALAVYDFQVMTGAKECLHSAPVHMVLHILCSHDSSQMNMVQAGILVGYWSCCWTALNFSLFPAVRTLPSFGKLCIEPLCSCPLQVSSAPERPGCFSLFKYNLHLPS